MAWHQMAYFLEPEFSRLNVSIVGIGYDGCALLNSVVKGGVPYALTLAIPTDENKVDFRNPVSRLYTCIRNHSLNSNAESITRTLAGTDLLILLFSCESLADNYLALECINTIISSNSCDYIVITDQQNSIQTLMSQLHRGRYSSVLSVGHYEAANSRVLVSEYIRTLLDMVFNHRLLGIEYYEWITFTGGGYCYNLHSIHTAVIDLDRIKDIPELLLRAITAETKRLIARIKYGKAGFDPFEVYNNIQMISGPEIMSCFVSDERLIGQLEITAILFE